MTFRTCLRPPDAPARSLLASLALASSLLAASVTPAPAQGFGWFGNLFSGFPRPAPSAPANPGPNNGGTGGGYAPRAPSGAYYARPRHHVTRRRPSEQVQQIAPKEKAPPPKNASMFVDVFGDSLGQLLGGGLDEALADRTDVAVVQKAHGSTGLVMTEYYNWPKAIDDLLTGRASANKDAPETGKPAKVGDGKAGGAGPDQGKAGDGKAGEAKAVEGKPGDPKGSEAKGGAPKLAKDRIDVAVMMIGSNDRQPMQVDGKTLQPGTAEWTVAYTKRVLAIDEAFRAKAIPLIWVGVPITKDDAFADAMAGLNDVFRDAAAKTGATYVDTWEAFSDDNGDFAAYGPDINGQTVRLRAADGIHFTKAGARKLAHFVEVHVRRALEGKAPLPQLPTAEEPDTGEKGGRPAVAARPDAGPIHNLNEAPNAANGTLAAFDTRREPGGRGGERDSLASRLPGGPGGPAPVGRADDAHWSGDPRAEP